MLFDVVSTETLVTEKAISVTFNVDIQLLYAIDKQIFQKAINDVIDTFTDRPGFPVNKITIT